MLHRRRNTAFRIAAVIMILAVAFVMVVACGGDMSMFMTLGMACAVVLTAIVVAQRTVLLLAKIGSRYPSVLPRAPGMQRYARIRAVGPPLRPLSVVLRT